MPRMDMPEGANVAVPGEYSLVKSALSNKGNPTSQAFDNLMLVEAKQPVRIIDNSGKVLFEGTGPAAARQAVAIGQNLSDTLGNKAGWDIQTVPVGTSNFKTIANEKVNDMGALGTIMDIGLPILMNALLPGSGFLGQALGKVGATMVASGLGSALSGTVQGKSLGDIAKSAGLSAATAGLLKGTPVGGFLDKAVGSIPVVGDVVKAAANIGQGALPAAAADEIVVTATRPLASSLAGSALSSSLANSIASKYPAYTPSTVQSPLLQQTPPEPSGLDALSDITITGNRLPTVSPFAVDPIVQNLINDYAVQPAAQPVEQPVQQQEPDTAQDNIVVTAQKPLPTVSPFAVDPIVQNLINDYAAPPSMQPVKQPVRTQEPDVAQDEIVVTAQKPLPSVSPFAVDPIVQNLINDYAVKPTTEPQEPKTFDDEIVVTAQKPLPPIVPPLSVPSKTLNPLPAEVTKAAETAPEAEKKSDFDKALAAAKAASLLLPLLGGKGGGDQAAGTISGGLGSLNPIFSAKLPTNPTNIPGGVGTAANFAPRPMSEQDWLTYGQRPEQSFFNYVPQQPTGMAHGGSFAAKRGGRSSFAVNGPGTGRSDDIPAVLSDGEYVIDAETVALLGDGSSKAGAKKLDDLRVKVRKHKGQKLAKGRFSANAKSPEAYLSGGRI